MLGGENPRLQVTERRVPAEPEMVSEIQGASRFRLLRNRERIRMQRVTNPAQKTEADGVERKAKAGKPRPGERAHQRRAQYWRAETLPHLVGSTALQRFQVLQRRARSLRRSLELLSGNLILFIATHLLWSRLSNAISGFNINIQTTIAPSASLNSDVNILISHGSRDISTSHNISPGEGTTLVGTDLLISRGSILILFICHSGSMTKALFRDKVMSLIRQYFQAGCQAIVAPLWSLHVSVPPIWLPAFINSIENNDTVAEAVHKANMEVYSINKNPGAWACLHLYGNPYIKIHSHN